MTKYYCDRCKEEIDFHNRRIVESRNTETIGGAMFVLCPVCYKGLVENFMHAFDEVIEDKEDNNEPDTK